MKTCFLTTRPVKANGLELSGYVVSNFGEIWSERKQGNLKPWLAGGGYECVSLRCNGKSIKAYVHRIVAESFLGPIPTGLDVCHNNGNRTDNRIDNLRFDTRKGNLADRKEHGTQQTGERNPSAKLTNQEAEQIKKRRLAGESLRSLANYFRVRESTISRIANGVRRAAA